MVLNLYLRELNFFLPGMWIQDHDSLCIIYIDYGKNLWETQIHGMKCAASLNHYNWEHGIFA